MAEATQPSGEWNEFFAWAKKLGYRPSDISRILLGRSSNPGTSQVPRPVESEDDLAGDLIRTQKQMMKASLVMNMAKGMGLLGMGNGESKPLTVDDVKKLMAETQSSGNKFTKDDLITLMMMRTMQGQPQKDGLDMGDMMAIMTFMDSKKGSSMAEVMAFMSQLEAKKNEGKEEEAKKWAEIRSQQPVETFDSFVSERARESLKAKVGEQIDKMFTTPGSEGIMNNRGGIDWDKLGTEIIKVAREAVKKMPESRAAPPEIEAAEVPPEQPTVTETVQAPPPEPTTESQPMF